jgi:MoxR-like ATPase
MAARWQLLERRVEHEAVRSTLTGGESRGVVVVGAAGVGKTTLARTVTASLEPISNRLPPGAVPSSGPPTA